MRVVFSGVLMIIIFGFLTYSLAVRWLTGGQEEVIAARKKNGAAPEKE